MRKGISRLVVAWLVLAASSLALAENEGPAPRKAESAWPAVAIPRLPPGTLPPVALPIDLAQLTPVAAGGRADGKDGSITLPGTIRPTKEVSVNPTVSGQVIEIRVEEGEPVKAGQVLARLDPAEYDLKVKRAQAQLDRAKALVMEAEAAVGVQSEVKKAEAAVKQAEAQRNLARRKLERMRSLASQNTVEQRLVDEAQEQANAAEAQVDQATAALKAVQAGPERARVMVARADVAVAEAELQLARMHAEATLIRAPAAGTILSRHVKVGDGVGPAQANGRPAPLFELADLTQLDAVVNIPEKDLVALKVGQKCEVPLDALPGPVFAGKVSRIAPVVSRQDRTAAVRVKLDLAPNGPLLSPGMYGTVRILGKP